MATRGGCAVIARYQRGRLYQYRHAWFSRSALPRGPAMGAMGRLSVYRPRSSPSAVAPAWAHARGPCTALSWRQGSRPGNEPAARAWHVHWYCSCVPIAACASCMAMCPWPCICSTACRVNGVIGAQGPCELRGESQFPMSMSSH